MCCRVQYESDDVYDEDSFTGKDVKQTRDQINLKSHLCHLSCVCSLSHLSALAACFTGHDIHFICFFRFEALTHYIKILITQLIVKLEMLYSCCVNLFIHSCSVFSSSGTCDCKWVNSDTASRPHSAITPNEMLLVTELIETHMCENEKESERSVC